MKCTTAVFMPRLLLVFVLLLLVAPPVAAQVGQPVYLKDQPEEREPERRRSPFVISPGLYTPEGHALAQRFQAARAAGLLPRPAKAAGGSYAIGDTEIFNTQRFPDFTWSETAFTLKAEGDGYRLWVATGELDNGHVTDADVDALAEALTERTPEGSIDPEQGILSNNAALFGEVPNVDGDGILDILWYNIRDLYPSPLGPIVLGYIAPEDYAPDAAQGTGNGADVLYLDTNPLLTGNVGEVAGNPLVIVQEYGREAVAQVAAQVHQQLIHLNEDEDEGAFVAQGLGTWAALLNGYDTCEAGYLQDPAEHFTIPLLYWDAVSQAMQDIQRSALFTTYFAEQLGQEAGIALMQASENGADGYRAVLAAHGETRTLEELAFDFHTANYVADLAFDSRFGYSNPACQDVQAPPTERTDGSLGRFVTPFSVPLQAGSIVYLVIENIRNLDISLNVPDAGQQDHIRFRAVGERLDGSIDVRELTTGTNQIMGHFASVTLIAFYDELDDLSAQGIFEMTAEWEDTAVFTEYVVYDDGEALASSFRLLGSEFMQAVRFEVPPGAHLDRVYLAPYFRNQFVDANNQPIGTPEDPRDFGLHVWADDGAGRPGAELLALELTDPRPWDQAELALRFFTVDLSGQPELETLPEVIYVGLSNAGTDENVLILATSTYEVENTSFLFGPINERTDWFSLWNLTLDGNSLENHTLPIRAQFRNEAILTDIAGPAEVPEAVMLNQNYPNPFNPVTTIRYEVPEAVTVRLAVYDVLGRQVAVLADGHQAGGTYEVSLDASGWASGIYFYTIETERQNLTRRMLLIK